ncbi:MAG TPA: TetR family transcriptional regulator [Jatrophihabitantaceae bacterium]
MPSRPVPVRRPSDERRRDLVEAALRVMSRDGVAAASTRAITTEAGMAQSRFHYCFRSKAELLREVVETMVRNQVTSALAAVRGAPAVGPGASASTALRAYAQHLVDHPEQHLLSYELTQYALRTPGLAQLAAQQYEAYLDGAAEVLAALGITDPSAPRLVVALLDGVTLQWLVDRDVEAAVAVLERFADLFAPPMRPRRAG